MQYEVTAHQSPYKRIEIGAREWPKVVEMIEVSAPVVVPGIWGNVVWTAGGGVAVEDYG